MSGRFVGQFSICSFPLCTGSTRFTYRKFSPRACKAEGLRVTADHPP